MNPNKQGQCEYSHNKVYSHVKSNSISTLTHVSFLMQLYGKSVKQDSENVQNHHIKIFLVVQERI